MNRKNTVPTLSLIIALTTLLLLLLSHPTQAITNQQPVIINELDAQTPGTDREEFIELYDGGTGSTSLDGLIIVLFNGGSDNDPSYRVIDLNGHTTDSNGYFVVGNAAVPNADLTISNGALQNGPDAAAVYSATVDDFPTGTPVTSTNLIDAIVYDDYNSDDAQLRAILLNPDQPIVLEGATSTESSAYSAQRCPNGSGGQRNTDQYAAYAPTPGGPNECVARPVVLDVFPNDSDTDISTGTTIRATFNTTMTNVSTSTFLIHSPDGAVPGTVSYSTNSQRATFNPTGDLVYNTRYTATLKAQLTETGSVLLGEDYVWSFTTEGSFIYLPLILRQ
ncbi:MAG: hypothetical protein GY832_32550 [Chloroflexi bacterium]|nr:hypothetical protein [Chloroflexota bacterium]